MGFLSEARALRNAAMATIPRENGAPKIKPINPHLCDYDDEHAQITVIPLCGASSQLAAPRYVLFWPSGGVVPLINDTHDQVSQDLLSQTCAKDTAAALQTILGSLKEGAEQTSEGKVGKVETGIQVQPNSWWILAQFSAFRAAKMLQLSVVCSLPIAYFFVMQESNASDALAIALALLSGCWFLKGCQLELVDPHWHDHVRWKKHIINRWLRRIAIDSSAASCWQCGTFVLMLELWPL